VVSGRSLGVSERRAPRHPKPLVVRGLALGGERLPSRTRPARRIDVLSSRLPSPMVDAGQHRCPRDEACNLLPLISGRRPIAEPTTPSTSIADIQLSEVPS
jgi:hypothetical protein